MKKGIMGVFREPFCIIVNRTKPMFDLLMGLSKVNSIQLTRFFNEDSMVGPPCRAG